MEIFNTMTDNQKRVVIGLAIAFGCVLVALIGVLVFGAPGGQTPEPPPVAETATPVPEPATPEPLPPQADPVWERIQANGKMVVGISADYPPFSYVNTDYTIDGFDVALIKAIGQRIGVPLEIRNMAFDGLGNALQLGQIDVAVAAASISPERTQFVDFTDVYFVGEDAVLAANDSNKTVDKVEDFAPYRVAVQRGSIYEDWLRDQLVSTGRMPSQNLLTYVTAEEAVAALNKPNPAADFAVLDNLVADVAVSSFPVKVVKRGLNSQQFAVVVPKGADTLRISINNALGEMRNDGTLGQLTFDYLKIENLLPTPTPAPTLPPATPATCLDGMKFVADLNYADNNMTTLEKVQPGSVVYKGWRVRNVGTCVWDSSYVMHYVGANPPNSSVGGNPVAIKGVVLPGQEYDIYVNLSAPIVPGIYQSFWQLKNNLGAFFGDRLYAGFEVEGSGISTPLPPEPKITRFTVDQKQIIEGSCVRMDWAFDGPAVTFSRLFRDGDVILTDLGRVGDYIDCPTETGTREYRLLIQTENSGSSAQAYQFVEVLARTVINPTPPPTPIVSIPRINYFESSVNKVVQGQCLDLEWSFEGTDLATAEITRNGETIIIDPPPTGDGEDCPEDLGQTNYILKVDTESGGTAEQSIIVTVLEPETDQPPVIEYFKTDFTDVNQGQCFTLSWSYYGQSIATVRLTRNGEEILTDPPSPGSVQECDLEPGRYEYILNVDPEFGGSAQQTLFVNVYKLVAVPQ